MRGFTWISTYTRRPPTPRRESLRMKFMLLFIGLAEVAIMDSGNGLLRVGMYICLFKLT